MYFALTHFNGKTVKCNDHPAVKDKLTCAVVLEMGDFAIFEVQYRCGGPRVKRDFEALELLQYINVPSTAYDPNFRGPFTEVIPQAAERDEVCEVHAMIDYAALAAWYGDFKTKGEQAYLRSHYGEARARMSQSGNRALEQHFGMLMNMMRSGEFGNPEDRRSHGRNTLVDLAISRALVVNTGYWKARRLQGYTKLQASHQYFVEEMGVIRFHGDLLAGTGGGVSFTP